MIIDIYFQISYILIFLFTIITLSYYLIRLKRVKHEINESSDIISIIINELKQRLTDQDKNIIDQDVKLDILELKINKILKQNIDQLYNNLNINKNVTDMILTDNKISHDISKFNKTEELILSSLMKKEYSANELQNIINKTREHTSRLLKNLFNNNIISRDERNKPYIYRLTNKDITFE